MITIVSGTNRKNSKTLILSEFYQKLFSKKNIASTLFSLTELPSDLINTDLYGKRSKEFEPIQNLVFQSEKFLFVIPEYNGSFPGVLKTFIDCCKFPESFSGKKAALTGVSTGRYGNIRGVDHFTGICNYIGLQVLPLKLHISHIAQDINAQGEITNPETLKFIEEQIDQFITF